MPKLLFAAFFAIAIATIAACGGSSSPAAPPPPPPTTQPPPPAYGGTYTGTMLFNVAGQAEIRVPGSVTVTHTGNNLDFSSLVITLPSGPVSLPLGRGTLNGNAFTGTHSYNSSGCGTARVSTQGHFAGRLMNLSAVFNFDRCDQSRTVGEMSR